jgi:hypothetical protein
MISRGVCELATVVALSLGVTYRGRSGAATL